MIRIPERHSAQARWSRRLAVFAVPVIAITALLHRFGGLDTATTLVLLGIALSLALAAAVLGVVALALIWRRGDRGTRHALIGLMVSAAILAWPAWLLTALATLPAIHDVTTDWQSPPPFVAGARDRPADANSIEYPGIDAARAQSAAYPELAPFFLGYSAEDVFAAVQALVDERGWRELVAEAPAFDGPGRIEAVAHTLIFGFEDDVVIVVAVRGPEQTRIDMRSASRFGRHDFGANADRIYRFLTDLQRRLDSPPEPAEGTVGETG